MTEKLSQEVRQAARVLRDTGNGPVEEFMLSMARGIEDLERRAAVGDQLVAFVEMLKELGDG